MMHGQQVAERAATQRRAPIQQVARALLALESTYQRGRLTREQAIHWDELVLRLLDGLRQQEHEQRGNLRLPAQTTVVLRLGADAAECRLLNLSHFGLAVRGDLSRVFTRGARVEVLLPGMDHVLDGLLVWKRGRWLAGVRLVDVDVDKRRSFFQAIYYPSYSRFLRQLAEARD